VKIGQIIRRISETVQVTIIHTQEVAYGLSTDTEIDGLERRNGRYSALFRRIRELWWQITSKWLKLDSYCLRQKFSPRDTFRQYVIYGDILRDY